MTNEEFMKDRVIRTLKIAQRTSAATFILVGVMLFGVWQFSVEISQLKARVAALEALVQVQE